jgi:hypothetical protein
VEEELFWLDVSAVEDGSGLGGDEEKAEVSGSVDCSDAGDVKTVFTVCVTLMTFLCKLEGEHTFSSVSIIFG